MTCVFMKVEVKKIILQEWLQLQMKFVWGDYMKIAIWWWRNYTFDREICKFIKDDFSGGGNE